jgi:hypothetical protein
MLKQQTLVPDSVESLFEVKERCCTVLFKLKGGSYHFDYSVTLKDGGVDLNPNRLSGMVF